MAPRSWGAAPDSLRLKSCLSQGQGLFPRQPASYDALWGVQKPSQFPQLRVTTGPSQLQNSSWDWRSPLIRQHRSPKSPATHHVPTLRLRSPPCCLLPSLLRRQSQNQSLINLLLLSNLLTVTLGNNALASNVKSAVKDISWVVR